MGARGGGRWWGEGGRVFFGFAVDDGREGGGVEPGGADDVGAALLFEEEGEPEGEFGAVGGAEGGGFALEMGVSGWFLGGKGGGGRTPRRWMLSRRWRGTIVTSSISATKATSAWVRPGGRGSAIL